jgi:acetyl coenzyme A synthetase (ADP forming)-like protein
MIMDLKRFFYPETVAVIGASTDPTKIGYQIVNNLKSGGYGGNIVPINRNGNDILGFKTYKSIGDYPGKVDLAILSVPAHYTPAVAEECGKKGVFGIVVVASGFAETGNTKLENELSSVCKKYNVRILGPNVVGIMNSTLRLNASFAPYLPYPGSIGMISQSGAMIIALDARTLRDKVGMSHLISIGNMADLGFPEVISFLNQDDNVSCMSIYAEGIKDGREFVETARTIKKPIIMLKAGVSKHGTIAAASHTGSLAGSHKVYDGALMQAGVIRAYNIDELFDLSLTLSLQPGMEGDNLTVVTNGGGIGVLATDSAEQNGIPLNDPPEDLKEVIKKIIPEFGSLRNPIDMSAMASSEMYSSTISSVMDNQSVSAVLAMYCEVANLAPMDAARGIVSGIRAAKRKVPVVAAFVGGVESDKAIEYLIGQGIPSFGAPDIAVDCISALRLHVKLNNEICTSREQPDKIREASVSSLIKSYLEKGLKSLNEIQSKEIFNMYGININKTDLATSIEEAEKISSNMKFPLVLKIQSPDILHKSDVGGVIVDIKNKAELIEAYNRIIGNVSGLGEKAHIDGITVQEMVSGELETVIGTVNDPTFGPTVMFGMGGTQVQAINDVTFRMAPVCKSEAIRMIDSTIAGTLMNEFRGRGKLDSDSVADQIVRFSWLAFQHPEIKSIDANPVIVAEHGSTVVDARVML